ncbi:VP4 [Rotavirus I]|uniref:VP4 n=1 Tax=Rotavirus I TaxID=1637496 RepID=A0A0E3JSL5_9REOV|nr:VP4 [Rotavirus I]AKA63276.1 VP4 [Rotavirus I]
MLRSLLTESAEMQLSAQEVANNTTNIRGYTYKLYNNDNTVEKQEVCYTNYMPVDIEYRRGIDHIGISSGADTQAVYDNYFWKHEGQIDKDLITSQRNQLIKYCDDNNMYIIIKIQFLEDDTILAVNVNGSITSLTGATYYSGDSGIIKIIRTSNNVIVYNQLEKMPLKNKDPCLFLATALFAKDDTYVHTSKKVILQLGYSREKNPEEMNDTLPTTLITYDVENRMRTRTVSTRDFNPSLPSHQILQQKVEGFWKIVSEVFNIKLKITIDSRGIMGGPFGDWLVDNSFVTVENKYTYQRDDETINAITITTCYPSAQTGTEKPWAWASDFKGHAVALIPGDIVEVRYTEDKWTLANSLYAKDFDTDSQASFTVPSTREEAKNDPSDIKFYMNYIPAFAYIKNSTGMSHFKFHSGGFTQIDAKGYTGLAMVFRFKAQEFDKWNSNIINPEYGHMFSNIGDHGLNTQYNPAPGAQPGFQACYAARNYDIDMRVAYTALTPSDPEFTNGSTNFVSTVTLDIEKTIDSLQQHINKLQAEVNIGQVTTGIFELLTNLYNLPQTLQGFMSTFRDIRSAIKRFSNKRKEMLKGRNREAINSKYSLENLLSTTDTASLNDDQLLSLMSKTSNIAMKADNVNVLQPVVAATILESTPLLQTTVTSRVRNKFVKMQSRVIPEEGSLLEIDFNRQRLTFASHSGISTIPIDYETIDEILGSMSHGFTRSLFSLQMRKNVFNGSGIGKHTLDDIINDKKLLDVTGHLTPDLQRQFFIDFINQYAAAMKL